MGIWFSFFLIRILVMFGAAAASGRAASVRCFGGGARFFHHFLTFVRGLQHFSLVSLREQASIRPRRFADNLPSLFGERLFFAYAFLIFHFRTARREREKPSDGSSERDICSRQDQLLLIAFLYFTLEFHLKQRIFHVRPKLTNSLLYTLKAINCAKSDRRVDKISLPLLDA